MHTAESVSWYRTISNVRIAAMASTFLPPPQDFSSILGAYQHRNFAQKNAEDLYCCGFECMIR